jgi:tRNA uridine 5-carboxymethylaminomethyl modification enzyme
MLNKSKGPAVWSPRCQSDRKLYSEEALKVINTNKNITIIESTAASLKVDNNRIEGVITTSGIEYSCKALILSSGTFLNGKMHTGLKSIEGGRFGEKSSNQITESLHKLGFISGRLKTGTPPRLSKTSINWDILEIQPGDEVPQPFSFQTDKSKFPFLPQLSCYITHTDEGVHKILESGFDKSPMFRGIIKGTGARYCPSIEDKIVRFADKKQHQLFLEPEGLDSDLIYLNGFSTSLPADIQLKAIHKIRGLEDAEMVRPGYAVEYDFFPPHQVDLTLETKLIDGLYFAGQVNGTSGYEEAAAQGLMAGINAACKIKGLADFVLKRSEAYIGVLIDDLVNKSTDEPYRMFTSRAEHRLLLRQDNADRRLMGYGFDLALIPEDFHKEVIKKEKLISISKEIFNHLKLHAKEINPFLKSRNLAPIDSTETVSKLIKRPELNLEEVINLIDSNKNPMINHIKKNKDALSQVEIELKYEGYLKRQDEMVQKLEKYEGTNIPLTLNYLGIKALSTEGKEKLNKIKPRSIGQAQRISGVTPSDISVLLVYLKN